MHLLFVNFQQLFEEKLAQLSSQETVIAIYLEQHHALLGALIHLLKINLADVLLGKASTDDADVMLLTFADAENARAAFRAIPEEIDIEGHHTALHVELWHQGVKEAETSCAPLQKAADVSPQTTSSPVLDAWRAIVRDSANMSETG